MYTMYFQCGLFCSTQLVIHSKDSIFFDELVDQVCQAVLNNRKELDQLEKEGHLHPTNFFQMRFVILQNKPSSVIGLKQKERSI